MHRKRFGQHFLTDKLVLEQIIAVIAPKPEDAMIEIGPGQGALTRSLLPHLNQLQVVEIDRDLAAKLKTLSEKLIVHEADVLEFNFGDKFFGDSPHAGTVPYRIVGNLPYNISTPLFFHLFKFINHIQDMHFMVQKEVADRLCANVHTKAYGRMTVMTQYFCQIEKLFDVSPEAFKPKPKVNSTFIRLIPHGDCPRTGTVPIANNFENFKKIVKQAFSQRRKTIRNTLKDLISAQELANLEIDATQRAEDITLEQFVAMSNYLKEK